MIHRPRLKWFKEVDVFGGGGEGIVTTPSGDSTLDQIRSGSNGNEGYPTPPSYPELKCHT